MRNVSVPWRNLVNKFENSHMCNGTIFYHSSSSLAVGGIFYFPAKKAIEVDHVKKRCLDRRRDDVYGMGWRLSQHKAPDRVEWKEWTTRCASRWTKVYKVW